MRENPTTSLRHMFDGDAERYDGARPGYPAQLFDDLTELAELRPGARVLEIGRTGQATVALAEPAFEIVAAELGPAWPRWRPPRRAQTALLSCLGS